uniref:Sodium/potassium-transporting ATPase subunit beta-1-interacting protein 3 isoform X3 n=1 Tax=Geotrypetes seraphini TaxID=260995 RepID=A0A6P8PZG9_GEOSA|nr:sodium/potassium-transporting ATPase subunit beta-1-interacting protein 3 isoform X3 [Geotrypetes seraphini]
MGCCTGRCTLIFLCSLQLFNTLLNFRLLRKRWLPSHIKLKKRLVAPFRQREYRQLYCKIKWWYSRNGKTCRNYPISLNLRPLNRPQELFNRDVKESCIQLTENMREAEKVIRNSGKKTTKGVHHVARHFIRLISERRKNRVPPEV